MRKPLSAGVALATMLAATIVGATVGAGPASAATTVRYGPFTIPAGSMGAPGVVENQLLLNVTKPCTGCYLTGMDTELVYADGSTANVNTGAHLHHALFASATRQDTTCADSILGPLGQRFFATGNERSPLQLPTGYGYPVPATDRWNLLIDLMNHQATAKTVYLAVDYTYTTSARTGATPVWLDIDQCGDSEYAVPAGLSDTHYDWQVTVPGDIVAIGGHLHEDGVRIEATNESTGQSICDSVAGYGETPEYVDMMGMAHVSSMSACFGDPVATVASGQTVRIHSIYDAAEAMDDVMGIMIAYIA